jgi:predicted kinase
MKTVYIFRGAPASGKGTIVPKFCELLPKPVALISQDTLRWGFHLVNRTVPDVTDEEHLFAYRNTLVMLEQYLKNGGYGVVLEGLFTWNDTASSQGNIMELVQLAERYGFTAKSIVLQADKAELLKRNADREYSVPADEFDQLYASIYKTVDNSEVVIDSTGQTLDQTLEQLKALV